MLLVVSLIKEFSYSNLQGRRQKNFQGRGANGKKTEKSKNSKKFLKIALVSLFPGGGGQRKKGPKNSKKTPKIALLSLFLLYLYHV